MDTLQTNNNTDFDANSTGEIIAGVKCKMTYTSSIEFKTIVDDHFSGHEQRRDQWSSPRRGWILEFSKDPENTKIMSKFFIRQKGKKKAFYWKWDSSIDGIATGGDDVTYNVRFDVDKLDFAYMEYGYTTFRVPIVQVMSGE